MGYLKDSRKDFERLSKCGDKSKLVYTRVYILIEYRFSISIESY